LSIQRRVTRHFLIIVAPEEIKTLTAAPDAENQDGIEKAKTVLLNAWGSTATGLNKGVDYTLEGTKKIGKSWDNSEAGQKINAGASIAVEKTKEYSTKAWDAMDSGITAIKNNETVQNISTTAVEKTKEWSSTLWGWVKKATVGEKGEVRRENNYKVNDEANFESLPDMDENKELQAPQSSKVKVDLQSEVIEIGRDEPVKLDLTESPKKEKAGN
jgi:hypothetical protein